MTCSNCGQEEGWTKTPVGMKDNIRTRGALKECKKCGHTWNIQKKGEKAEP